MYRQVYDHVHQKASRAAQRVKKPLLNVSTKVRSYYEKCSWVSGAAKRSAPYVIDLCFFLIPSYLPSASFIIPPSIEYNLCPSRIGSSQAPLKVNTLEKSIIHCSYVSQLVRFSTRAYHPFAVENIWKVRIFSTALHGCITYPFPNTRRKVLVVQARGNWYCRRFLSLLE